MPTAQQLCHCESSTVTHGPEPPRGRFPSWAAAGLGVAIQLYRWVLSPAKNVLFGPLARCRFTPSCSEYALEAVRAHGAWRGGWLAIKRLMRCHPWHAGGHDPVPPAATGRTTRPPG